MKILVTGATGSIGQHVVGQLLSKGHNVVATGRDVKKATVLPWFKQVDFIEADLNSLGSIENVYTFFGKPDLLIDLAWEGLPQYTSAFHLEKNYPTHKRFLEQMIAGGLSSLLVTGTCLEYGLQSGCLSEDLPTRPTVAYAQAKHKLLEDILSLQLKHKFVFKWVRIFYTFGGLNENSLLSQLDKALQRGDQKFNMSGGEQQRDYLSVAQVGEYIVKIALQDKVTGVINCCSGQAISIKKFVQNYLAQKNKNIELNLGHYPYLEYEPMVFWGDTHKLKEALSG